MKLDNILIICLVLLALGCDIPSDTDNRREIQIVSSDSLILIPNEGLILYQDEPFSGISQTFYPNDSLAEIISYKKGIRHGKNKKYFSFGLLSYQAHYQNGKLHGSTTSWWKNGNIRSESKFLLGKANGVQTEWYKTGQKFKELNLTNGKENGMQTAWRKNGKIYKNTSCTKNGGTRNGSIILSS